MRPAMFAFILFASAVAGCTSAVEPLSDEDAFVQTGGAAFTLSSSGAWLYTDVPYVFTNSEGSPVYLANCLGSFGYWLERYEDGAWRNVWSPVQAACLSAPIVVQPGERLEGVFRVMGGLPGSNTAPRFDRADMTGQYRIVIDALSSYQDRLPFGRPIPLEHRVSNRFSLLQ